MSNKLLFLPSRTVETISQLTVFFFKPFSEHCYKHQGSQRSRASQEGTYNDKILNSVCHIFSVHLIAKVLIHLFIFKVSRNLIVFIVNLILSLLKRCQSDI